MDDPIAWRRVEPEPNPKPALTPKFIVAHSADVEVGDTVRVFELVDGAYREIEGVCRVVDG